MSRTAIILIVLLLFAFGGLGPWWGHSAGWGYGPGISVGGILVVVLVLALLGII